MNTIRNIIHRPLGGNAYFAVMVVTALGMLAFLAVTTYPGWSPAQDVPKRDVSWCASH